MARHKNETWTLPDGTPNSRGSTIHQWESINAALLMDIRDELQALNRTLGCYRVIKMTEAVDRIDKRLLKHLGPLRQKRTRK